MPRKGIPAGSTPSDTSSAKPPGIRPSPHALSIGSFLGSATITESPCWRAFIAEARPAGPPPTISRSASYVICAAPRRSGRRVVRVAQCGVLDPDPHPQQQPVRQRENNGCQPCRVHQWQRNPFGDDCHIVRVVQKPVRTSSYQGRVGHHDDQGVPPSAQRRYTPPAQHLTGCRHGEHRPSQPTDKGPVQAPHFDDAAQQQRRVEGDHHRIVTVTKFLAALAKSPSRIAFGYEQLYQPFDADGQNQQVIHVYQLSSTSSAEKPGPMAIISPREPGGGGSVMVSERISSTETDDRFPLLRRDFRVRSNASFGTSSTFSTASITFGPAA